jgi:Ca2+-binding EF-hand superfamily protein
MAAAAAADDPVPALAPPKPSTRELTPKEQELLKQLDANGYGKLDENELAAAHEAMRQEKGAASGEKGKAAYSRLLEAFDRDHNGRLDPAEQVDALRYLEEHNPLVYKNLLRRFDRNADGKLDAQESAAAFEALEKLSGAAPEAPQPQGPKPAAAPAPDPAGGKPRLMVYARLLEAFDHNGDGRLDAAEQAEAIAYMKEHNPRIYQFLATRFGTGGSLDAAGTAAAFDALKAQYDKQKAK